MAGALRTAVVVLVFLASPGLAGAGQPAPDDTRTGLIVGQVIDAGTGRPVGSAFVLLSGGALPPRTPVSSPPSPRPRLMTDAEGRFAFRGLSSGTYNITASKPGYVDGAYGRRRPGGATHPLPLATGEKVGDVTITVWRYATISGSVVDEAGEPVVGLEVRALRRTVIGGRQQFTAAVSLAIRPTGTTDDRGLYRIPGLMPGDYAVVAVSVLASVPLSTLDSYRDAAQSGNSSSSSALFTPIFQVGASPALPGTPGALPVAGTVLSLQRTITPPPSPDGRLFVYPTTYYPAAISPTQAGLVTIVSGEDRAAVDFHLRPVPTSRVAGTVTSAEGVVANLALTLNAVAAQEWGADAVAGTVTDANGAFTFPAVPAGQYTLRAVKEPAASRFVANTIVQSGSGMTFVTSLSSGPTGPAPLPTEPTLWASLPVSVGRTDHTGVSVMLQNGLRVSGRAEFEGTAAKPPPERLAAMPIALNGQVPRGGSLSMAGSGNTTWTGRFDSSGAFTTVGVPAGKYSLRVAVASPGWTVKSATLNGRDVMDVPFDLQADATGVVVTFTDQPTEVRGVATTGTGAPDPDATVVMFPSDPQAWTGPAPGSRRFRTARTGKDGTYRTIGLPAGSYYIVAIPDSATSEWTEPKYLEQLARLATTITVDDGEKKTHDLKTAEVR